MVGMITNEVRRIVQASWADMDFNRHMGNTSYLNICTTVRLMHFAEQGVATADFERLQIGPVVFRDEIEYFREVHLLEKISVTLSLMGCSEDASHFKLRNELWKENGAKAATVVSTGGWMNVATRKLVVPPDSIRAALDNLPKLDPFEVLQTIVKQS